MIQPPLEHRRSWFLVTSFIAFLSVALFSGYFQWQRSSFEKKIQTLKTQKEMFFQNFSSSRSQEKNGEVLALGVHEKLRAIENKQILWSKIMEKIENTVPKNKEKNEALIDVRSYSGTEEGKISLNATTKPSAAEPFSDVAAVIRAFVNEPVFRNVFIPSINKSLTPEGGTVLSFSLLLEYQKPTL